jgi:molybdopterin converting factor small subunit
VNIRIQFFSRLRQIGGDAVLTRDWPAETDVQTALAYLEKEFPPLADWQSKLLFAVGVEFAQPEQILHEGDLFCLMPPVQGG